ncbi:hypothetical protein Tco_0019954 [Tanacetum coccineum]
MVEKSKLDEDKEGKAVDLSHYLGMIGTLLYLTDNRPDLQFAIWMYARKIFLPLSCSLLEHGRGDSLGLEHGISAQVKVEVQRYRAVAMLRLNATMHLLRAKTMK